MAKAVPLRAPPTYTLGLTCGSQEPPGGRFELAPNLTGILAFIPDGGDDPNHIPTGLLPHNAQANPRPARIETEVSSKHAKRGPTGSARG